MSISHAEAQELHECIGFPIEFMATDKSNDWSEEIAMLTRAEEIAAIIVSDTDPDRED